MEAQISRLVTQKAGKAGAGYHPQETSLGRWVRFQTMA